MSSEWNGAKLRHFWDGFGFGFFTGSGSGFEKDFLAYAPFSSECFIKFQKGFDGIVTLVDADVFKSGFLLLRF